MVFPFCQILYCFQDGMSGRLCHRDFSMPASRPLQKQLPLWHYVWGDLSFLRAYIFQWSCNKLPLTLWLTQHKSLTLQIWKSEVYNGPHWATPRCLQSCIQVWRLGDGRENVLLSFLSFDSLSRFCSCSLSMLKASQDRPSVSHIAFLGYWFSCLPLPSLENPCGYIVPHQKTQDNFQISGPIV